MTITLQCTCPPMGYSSSDMFIHAAGCPVLESRRTINAAERITGHVAAIHKIVEAPELKMRGPYDKELGIFSSLMRMKLEKYAHRGRWEGSDLAFIMRGLRAEVDELEKAIQSGDTLEIMLEGADVGNFALIAVMTAIRGKTDESKRKTDTPEKRDTCAADGKRGPGGESWP